MRKIKFADGSVEHYEDNAFASGAEGEIFLSRDKKSVIKLYYADPSKDAERIERIDKLINEFNPTKGNPYWKQFFTWPEKRVVYPQVGFRMPFVSGLKTLDHYIFGKSYKRLKPDERGWFIGRIAVAIKLVSAANQLDSMGLCYTDFSHRNVLVDPFAGRIVLIDCDSLTVPSKLAATVEGTTSYRAPEIVQRLVTIPSVMTDRHALAVILYLWLLLWHPLLGDKIFDHDDPELDDQLRFGQHALYIEHPFDKSNRARKQVLKATILGPELEKLFQTAFVDGLHKPHRRPSPYQWQKALYHTYDHIIPCTSEYCDWRFFVVTDPQQFICPRCEQHLESPKTLPFVYLLPHMGTKDPNDYSTDELDAHYVVGWPERQLHQWHARPDDSIYTDPAYIPDTTPYAKFDYDELAEQWFLKNLALPDMCYSNPYDPSKSWIPLPIKSSIPLTTDMMLQFGKAPNYFRAKVIIEKV